MTSFIHELVVGSCAIDPSVIIFKFLRDTLSKNPLEVSKTHDVPQKTKLLKINKIVIFIWKDV
jgi:hypothetical protein